MSAEQSQDAPDGRTRSVAKKLLWPARRFFDPRFIGIHTAVQEVKSLLAADVEAANEFATYTGRTLERSRPASRSKRSSSVR